MANRIAIDWGARTGVWALLTLHEWDKHSGLANWQYWWFFASIALISLIFDVVAALNGSYKSNKHCRCKCCADPWHEFQVSNGDRKA